MVRTATLDEIDIREIAAELRRDIRTVRKVAAGKRIRGRMAEAEIRRAIAARIFGATRRPSQPPAAA